MLRCGVACALVLAAAAPARADDLFDPTPDDQLRELATDRPHTTETPITVDAGHVQIEMDALRYQIDDLSTDIAMAATLMKLGLTDTVDIELGVEPLRSVHGRSEAQPITESSGYGDTIVRLKWTFLSIPDQFVVGLLPYAIHVRAFGAITAGAALVFEVPLGPGADVEWMLRAASRAIDGGGRVTELLATLAVAHPIAGDLAAFLEAELGAAGDASWYGALRFNGGLLLPLANQVQLDAGVRVPAVGPVPFELFAGVSARR